LVEAAIAGERAMAYGFDAGTLYRVNSHLALAAVLSNLGSKLTFVDQADSLPLNGRLGFSYWPSRYWAVLVDGVYARTGLASGRAGLEWNPLDVLSLRAGYRTDTTRELSAMAGLTTGIGIHVFGQEFDYAWVPLGDLGSTHYFSLVLRFRQAENEKRNLIRFHERRDVSADNPENMTFYDPPMLDLDQNPQAAQTSPEGAPAQ
jgi:hypothetical protein